MRILGPSGSAEQVGRESLQPRQCAEHIALRTRGHRLTAAAFAPPADLVQSFPGGHRRFNRSGDRRRRPGRHSSEAVGNLVAFRQFESAAVVSRIRRLIVTRGTQAHYKHPPARPGRPGTTASTSPAAAASCTRTQRHDRVYPSGASRGHVAGEQRHGQNHEHGRSVRQRITAVDIKEESGNHAMEHHGSGDSEG